MKYIKSNSILVVVSVFFGLLVLGGAVYFLNMDSSDDTSEASQTPQITFGSEQPLDSTETVQEQGFHNLKLEIISPDGDTFYARQARMYKAYLTGNYLYEGVKIDCNWTFYLNQNNEEVAYEFMQNSSLLKDSEQEVCAFTSTFIEDRGELRVELVVTVPQTDSSAEGTVQDSAITDRVYKVI